MRISCICGLLFGLLFAESAFATSFVFDLEGRSAAPIARATPGLENFIVDWSGATLTYDDMAGKVSLSGTVKACLGGNDCAGSETFSNIAIRRIKGFVTPYKYKGNTGTFELDATFNVDPTLTTGFDAIFAQADNSIGSLTQIDDVSKLPRGFNVKSHNPIDPITLSLKSEPNLGFAFSLMDDGNSHDNRYQIDTWLLAYGKLLTGGGIRIETRATEEVFNGEIYAILRGGGNPPPTEVPEPGTLALLSAGILGIGRKMKKRQAKS